MWMWLVFGKAKGCTRTGREAPASFCSSSTTTTYPLSQCAHPLRAVHFPWQVQATSCHPHNSITRIYLHLKIMGQKTVDVCLRQNHRAGAQVHTGHHPVGLHTLPPLVSRLPHTHIQRGPYLVTFVTSDKPSFLATITARLSVLLPLFLIFLLSLLTSLTFLHLSGQNLTTFDLL